MPPTKTTINAQLDPILAAVVLGVLSLGCGGDPPPRAIGTQVAPIKGGQVDPGHPSVVRLRAVAQSTPSLSFLSCTATLIGTRSVVTAAHCLVPGNDAYVEVGGVLYKANKAVRHPSYGGGHVHDIAVVTVPSPIPGAALSPIASTPPLVAQAIALVGYGWTGPDDTSATDRPKQVGYNTIAVTDASTFRYDNDATTCPGDSGGPTFARGSTVLLGVHSTGSCVSGANQAFDMRVDAYLGWIRQVAADATIQSISNPASPQIRRAGVGCPDMRCLWIHVDNPGAAPCVQIRRRDGTPDVLDTYCGADITFDSSAAPPSIIVRLRDKNNQWQELAQRGLRIWVVNPLKSTWSDPFLIPATPSPPPPVDQGPPPTPDQGPPPSTPDQGTPRPDPDQGAPPALDLGLPRHDTVEPTDQGATTLLDAGPELTDAGEPRPQDQDVTTPLADGAQPPRSGGDGCGIGSPAEECGSWGLLWLLLFAWRAARESGPRAERR